MKKLFIVLGLAVTACAAQGPAYTGKEKGNVVVYRISQLAGAGSPYHVQIGDKHCSLKNGGFFPVNIKKKDILTAGWVQGAVSSTIEVGPGDYVRVEHNIGNSLIGGLGMGFGAVGGAMSAQTSGDFIFNKIPATMAKSELQTLKQDCM